MEISKTAIRIRSGDRMWRIRGRFLHVDLLVGFIHEIDYTFEDAVRSTTCKNNEGGSTFKYSVQI